MVHTHQRQTNEVFEEIYVKFKSIYIFLYITWIYLEENNADSVESICLVNKLIDVEHVLIY